MFGIIWLVIRRKKYLALTAATTLVVFILSYFLTIWAITGKSIAAYIDMSSWAFTLFSLFLSLVIAVLFGVYLSLFLVRRRLRKEREIKNKLCSASGTAIGLFAAGCPTCGAPLFALFGAPLALFSLPFRGLELKVLSIALLALSIYLLVENIQKQLFCKVQTKIL
ncbi:MAG: hypothetical protein HZC26_00920 [Candidatus Magasanikbacteria bacterium]|nr:hypothetical protein [Candidatus Magasanikbacteria bacterium]